MCDKRKLLLDTDIGCDIDDWFALGWLLARPDVEILGITTVSGEPERRAMLADMICRLAGRTVPVKAGLDKPLLTRCRQTALCRGENAQLDLYPHGDSFPAGQAVEFMRETIEAHPGEVDLVAIGPLTNVALLFAAHPHIPALLKSLTVMGGRYADNDCCDLKKWGETEWNILCDPYAAAIVFGAPVKDFRVAGVEISCQVWQETKAVVGRFAGIPWMNPVIDAMARWDRLFWFHDPLAVISLFDRDGFTWQKGTVSVDLAPDTLGATRFTPDPDGAHSVVVAADRERFFRTYGSALGVELHASASPKPAL